MQTKSLIIKGIKTSYLELGKGKPLLFFHGHRSDALRWEGILRELAKKYKVYAPDLPGFGKSNQLPTSHKIENYLPYLLEFVKQLGLSHFVLVGASLGAVFASLLSREIPEKIEKIVLLGPIFDSTVLTIPKRKYLAAFFLLSTFPRSRLMVELIDYLIGSDRIFKNFLKLIFPPEQRTSELLDYEAKQWRVMSIKVWAETLRSLLTFKFPNRGIQVKSETTLVFSEKDQYMDVSSAIKNFSQIFPNNKVVIIPGLNHVPKGELSAVLKLPKVKRLLEEV